MVETSTPRNKVKQGRTGTEVLAWVREEPGLTRSCHSSPRVEAGVLRLPAPLHYTAVPEPLPRPGPDAGPREPICPARLPARAREREPGAHFPAPGPARLAAGAARGSDGGPELLRIPPPTTTPRPPGPSPRARSRLTYRRRRLQGPALAAASRARPECRDRGAAKRPGEPGPRPAPPALGEEGPGRGRPGLGARRPHPHHRPARAGSSRPLQQLGGPPCTPACPRAAPALGTSLPAPRHGAYSARPGRARPSASTSSPSHPIRPHTPLQLRFVLTLPQIGMSSHLPSAVPGTFHLRAPAVPNSPCLLGALPVSHPRLPFCPFPTAPWPSFLPTLTGSLFLPTWSETLRYNFSPTTIEFASVY